MTNPYHDENGKFCSKGEMRAAVTRVGKAGDAKNYLKLQAEYNSIMGSQLSKGESFEQFKEYVEISRVKKRESFLTKLDGETRTDVLTKAIGNKNLTQEESWAIAKRMPDGFAAFHEVYGWQKGNKEYEDNALECLVKADRKYGEYPTRVSRAFAKQTTTNKGFRHILENVPDAHSELAHNTNITEFDAGRILDAHKGNKDEIANLSHILKSNESLPDDYRASL